jgi:hypothetical protein
MSETVYILCGITSLACAVMLLRAFFANRNRLLFWAGLCFAGLTINNLILFIDLVIVTDIDLTPLRSGVALMAMALLLVGLVWHTP